MKHPAATVLPTRSLTALLLTGLMISTSQAQAQPYSTYSDRTQQVGGGDSILAGDRLDWVPKSELPDSQLARCPRGCDGDYLPPERYDEARLQNPTEAELHAEAGRTELDGQTGQALLGEGVLFTQGWRQVGADLILVDRNSNNYRMDGNITIREPGMLLTGESANVESATNRLELNQAQYVLHENRVHGSAERISRVEDGRIYIDNATYTTCEPHETDWIISAEQIEIDTERARIVASRMRLRARDLTIFYAPRISLPLGSERKTGLLYPVVESSGSRGIDFAQPVYINLAPARDLTLTPRIIQRRGAMLESEFRWLNNTGDGQLGAAFLPQDRGGSEGDRHAEENRWHAALVAEQAFFGGLLTADIQRVSDGDYFHDLGSASLQSSSRSWLGQHAEYRVDLDAWRFSLGARSFQNLGVEPLQGFSELPRLQLSGNWQNTRGFYTRLDQEVVRFVPLDRQSGPVSVLQSDEGGDWVEGARAGLDWRLGWLSEGSWHYARTELLLSALGYQLQNPLSGQSNVSPAELAPGVIIDGGLMLERETGLFGHSWLQTLEPRLQFAHVQAGAQQDQPLFDTFAPRQDYFNLFRHNRFSGGDRIEDASRLVVGLESRLLYPHSGRTRARFGLAQQYHLRERRVHVSPRIAAGLVDPDDFSITQPAYLDARLGQQELDQLAADRSGLHAMMEVALDNWSLRLLTGFAPRDREIERGELALNYRAPQSGSLYNLAYRYESGPLIFRDRNSNGVIEQGELFTSQVEQLDFSAVLELADHWTLIGRWQQDLSHRRPMEVFAGARYDACCWSLSLMWRHWLQRDDRILIPEQSLAHDNGIFVSLELKGLAGVGDRLDNLLRESIPGYP